MLHRRRKGHLLRCRVHPLGGVDGAPAVAHQNAARAHRNVRAGTLTSFPFAVELRPLLSRVGCSSRISRRLRTASLPAKCFDRETLLRFGPKATRTMLSLLSLLLQSRSALGAGPRRLTPRTLRPSTQLLCLTLPRNSTLWRRTPFTCSSNDGQRPALGGAVERDQFSRQKSSAGELLRTPERMPASMATVRLS